MSKHTKGPWKIDYPVKFINGHTYYYIRKDNEAETLIAQLWEGGGSKGKPIQKANANLIASAPELLEACKYASELLSAGNLGQDKLLIERLNQAIAKAEGTND